MPELPEVETVVRGLAGVLPGHTITQTQVLLPKSFMGDQDQLIGQRVVEVTRRAKMGLIRLADQTTLLIHLKMTGQLLFQPRDPAQSRVVGGHPTGSWIGSLPDTHTRVVIGFEHGSLYFNDQRTFGWIQHLGKEALEAILSRFGPDINSPLFDQEAFASLFISRRPVKVVLLDQSRVAGLGNIYVIDALNKAKIHPARSANSLNKTEITRLFQAAKTVIARGIQLGGATAADGTFLNTQGLGGRYQDEFLAYERQDMACKNPGCTGTIRKISIAGRGTYYCDHCQR